MCQFSEFWQAGRALGASDELRIRRSGAKSRLKLRNGTVQAFAGLRMPTIHFFLTLVVNPWYQNPTPLVETRQVPGCESTCGSVL